ncbi:MAG: TetR/AcrR family transcriptional regulator [Mariniphaga sp.]|nr:TetR/AcrR family transcriptional regulator [Mariniphaga sp.]
MVEQTNTLNEQFGPMIEQIKELFFEFGIKNLNMDDISRKLGISKKTLYRFVKSKEDLIAQLFEYEELKWIEHTKDISNQDVNAIEKLFKVSLMVYVEMKKFNPMLMFELRKYYETVFLEYHTRKLEQISQNMRLNLVQGIEEGLYRQDVNIDAVVAIYINYLIEIHSSDMCKTAEITFDELFKVMFENHIRAISTPAGVAFFEARKKEVSENLKNNNQ